MAERDETGRFLTGNSGGGRPKGSRNKLGEQFIQDMYADWAEHGVAAIQKVREERPQDYLKVVASILPKELHVKESQLGDMSEDEIVGALTAIRSFILAGAGAEASVRVGSPETRKSH